MKIKVNGKDIELNFGIGFLRSLDSVAGFKTGNLSFGMALSKTIPALQGFDPLALFNVIYAGTSEAEERPSQKDVEGYFNSLTNTQFEKLFDDTEKELKKSPMTRFTIDRLNKENDKTKAAPQIKL